MYLSISIPAAGALGASRGPHLPAFRLSPDGTRLVYVANPGGRARLYLRALDEREAKPIPGTEGALEPFFAPDGQSVGFMAGGKLKRVSLVDGTVAALCDAPTLRGAAWSPRGTIIFAPTFDAGLWQVPADGGKPTELTRLDPGAGENSHRWPEVLPNGKTVIFTIRRGGNFDNARVAAIDMDTGEQRNLFDGGSFAQYAPSGHLVYGRESSLVAVPFDPIRLQMKGLPFRILDGVGPYQDTGAAYISLSRTGSLAYVTEGASVADRTLVWVDEHGLAQPILPAQRGYEAPRLSPDGRRLAVTVVEGSDFGIWMFDMARETLSRVTAENRSTHAVWDPSDQTLTFSSSSAGPPNLFRQPADASHAADRLTSSPYWQWPTSWSPDGGLLAFTETHPVTGADIWLLERATGKRRPFMVTPAHETEATFSSDGRWLAFVSDESGAQEVYVRSYKNPGPKHQISTDGGTQPLWDRRGDGLFYRNGDKMMAVAVTMRPSFSAAKPRILFEGRYRGSPWWNHTPSYDVTPAGMRFVMIKESERATPPAQINIVLNWFAELARRAPARAN